MAKHVIFLGAGASYTSGYPLAAGLRFILSSPERFVLHLNEKIDKLPNLDLSKKSELKSKLGNSYALYPNEVKLFREGGFATVDEFSYLARERHEVFVQTLKRFTSLIFFIHNPERSVDFVNSDYYPFIQKLFDKSFHEFRDDVAVLTYNYDPYLDFLLSRAYRIRKKTSGDKSDEIPSGISSGFGDLDGKRLVKEKGFCFLKLHGTSVLPGFVPVHGYVREHDPLTFYEVFEHNEIMGSRLFAQADFGSHLAPPIFFPWELMNDHGEFVGKDKFRAAESRLSESDRRLNESGSYYEIFKAIWQRAQREIIDAEKISFVGLSMHEFLRPGMRYLFAERVRKHNDQQPKHNFDYTLEVVLACPGAWHSGENFKQSARPNSLVAKLAAMLHEVNPNMAGKIKGQIISHDSGKNAVGGIICYDDFKSFIEAEL